MKAGAAKIDITPERSVWMDGMIRAHRSEGIHDRLSARALVLANDLPRRDIVAVVSADLCALDGADGQLIRERASRRTGIPESFIIMATTHTHSGPATVGFFNPAEREYVGEVSEKLVNIIDEAYSDMKPVASGCASGREDTISHYRRLLADDGHVVMNWESYPADRIVRPLGEVDPEVGVLKLVTTQNPKEVVCILFNHAGHPNVMSGENYLLSGDYPGFATSLIEKEFGGTAIFLNGAQGTMDIDGLRDRDWAGVERTGRALAAAVSEVARGIVPSPSVAVGGPRARRYSVRSRKISAREMAWAEDVLRKTGGAMKPVRDGIGDDYRAILLKRLHEAQGSDINLEQTCFATDAAAFITFPGELFTEIGMRVKAGSPFAHTYIIGLANGNAGYVPTREAIGQGGYEVETRRLEADAEEIIVRESLSLLEEVHDL